MKVEHACIAPSCSTQATFAVDVCFHEDDHEGFHSRRFSREISLDGDVLGDEITAHYRNGMLEIRVPTEDTPEVIDEGRRIEIED